MALDALAGDPRRFHPVAGFGRAASWLEQRVWSDSRGRGAVFTAVCVGASAALGLAATRLAGSSSLARIGMTALATWATIGAKSLVAEGLEVHRLLDAGDLPGARQQITHLVGRDPSHLNADEIARAAVESVAENSSDAIVAPLVWGAIAGVPGLLGYRAANTLDAMVGYRNPRFERFGWASARLDDAVNFIPARLTGAVVSLLSDKPRAAWTITRRYARQHPSPNSGWCEASYAATLDLQLGGTNTYGERVEHRPRLGEGRAPTANDIARAVTLTNHVILITSAGTAAAALGITPLVTRIRRRSHH
ncbi:MAG: cobalamin biosynthesis protein [Nakamurella sp.]